MIQALIIADDLTGALDTAVHFAAAGFDTQVRVTADAAPEMPEDSPPAEVLSVNTGTRHVSPEEAYDVVRRLAGEACAAGIPCIYKKTDSALRGNTGAELCAVKNALGISRLPFIPAYPALGRTVEEGILYIDGVPAARTALGKDPFNPLPGSEVFKILAQTDVSGEADGIEIFDARTEQDLQRIGQALGNRVLHCGGSGGFAQVLAKTLLSSPAAEQGGRDAAECERHLRSRKDRLQPCQRLLLVCGSIHEKALEQVRYAARRGYTVLTSGAGSLKEVQEAVSEALRTRGFCVLSTCDCEKAPPAGDQDGAAQDEARDQGSVMRETAAIVREIFAAGGADSLCVFGGDTLLDMMDALGIRALNVRCELLPGVVLAEGGYRGKPVPVISKAGSFGPADVIEMLLQKIRSVSPSAKTI